MNEQKEIALEAINTIFGDMNQSEEDQIEVLEEIESLCSQNIEMLREQINMRK